MARGVNKVILIGNLGQDPDSRFTPNGTQVVNLNIATDDSYKNRETGQLVERTDWHRVVLFGKVAEVAAQYLRKGSKVYIEGKQKTRDYDDKEGIKRYITETVVDINGQMQMLDSREGSGGAPQGRQSSGGAGAQGRGGYAPPGGAGGMPDPVDDFDDDIPFNYGEHDPR